MHCASCVAVNTNSLKALGWVEEVSINLATKWAVVEFDETKISFEDITKDVQENGFKVEQVGKVVSSDTKDNSLLYRFLLSLVFSLPVFSMMFGEFMLGTSYFGVDIIMYIYALLSFVVVFILWFHFHKNAVLALRKLHFNMDSLVSLGTSVAFLYSAIAMFFHGLMVYFEAAVAIITLINLGRYLEHKAKSKAWDAIGKLLELWAKKATVISGEKQKETDIDDITIGERVIIKAWEKIALDGVIVEWSANCDESMLTGESIPVYKNIWDECYGGTINLDGNIIIEVTKENNQGTLAKIIELVDKAQSSKAPIQHLADKVSGVFVPIIITISAITFVSWYIVTWDISSAIVPAVASLVIACPCALGLATPTAIMVGTGVGAKNGILIKDAGSLEKTKDIDVVVFDKTWTLTNAKPEVTDVVTLGKTKDEVIALVISLASKSHHPLSKAIAGYDEDVTMFEVKNFEEIKWKWLQGSIDGKEIKLWNKKLFKKINEDVLKQLDELTSEGKTPIIIWDDTEIYGIIWLLDLPKEWVENTIQKLHALWIEVVMLTWDTRKTAQYIAKKIWIDTVHAEVLPEDKLSVIESLQKEWKRVAFVWDGINDAPALVQSDLSIAMGTGSDIAIESADIVLVKWNLDKVVSAIQLSRKTLRVIKQNLFWAFVYNTIWIPLAAFWLLNPIFASFAMSMSSVSVVSNSLRLKMFK